MIYHLGKIPSAPFNLLFESEYCLLVEIPLQIDEAVTLNDCKTSPADSGHCEHLHDAVRLALPVQCLIASSAKQSELRRVRKFRS